MATVALRPCFTTASTVTAEITARGLINEFFSVATITSVKQFLGEHENEIQAYTDKLEEANQKLISANGSLEESATAQLRLAYIITHELSNFLQCFATAVQLLQQESASSKNAAIANAQIDDMKYPVAAAGRLFHSGRSTPAGSSGAN
jgi:glycerol-3-phosphate O-acyltransferase